jgi:hypothetical protein
MRFSSKAKVSLVIVGSLAIGILLGSSVLANMFNQSAGSKGSEVDGLTLSGTETVKVMAPDGQVISTWQGPDPISSNVMSAFAGCATGLSQPSGSAPYGVFGSCEGWIGSIALWTDGSSGACTVYLTSLSKFCTYYNPVAATDTLTPIGCTTGSATAYGTCTGWITEATFGPTTFTSSSCGASCAVEEVIGASPAGWAFDSMCASTFAPGEPGAACLSTPIATVAPQDSLLVTIDFSVT